MQLKESVKRAAKAAGFTLGEIETTVGMAKGSISKWADHYPTVDKVKAVADLLNVTVDSLLTD